MTLGELYRLWQAFDVERVRFNKSELKTPHSLYWLKLDNYRDAARRIGHHWAINSTMELTHRKLDDEVFRHDASGKEVPPQSLYDALSVLGKEWEALPTRYDHEMVLPTPQEMMRLEGMTLERVAYKYHFFVGEGSNKRGDAAKIRQELDEPGSVITADWVHPLERERLEKREKLLAELDLESITSERSDSPRDFSQTAPIETKESTMSDFVAQLTNEQREELLRLLTGSENAALADAPEPPEVAQDGLTQLELFPGDEDDLGDDEDVTEALEDPSTLEKVKLVLQMHRSGMKVDSIVKVVGLPPSVVEHYINDGGPPYPDEEPWSQNLTTEKLHEYYQDLSGKRMPGNTKRDTLIDRIGRERRRLAGKVGV